MIYYSKGPLIVRNMEHKDAQAITDAEIEQGWNASVEKYQKRLEDQKSEIEISLVAEYFGNPVGYINVYPAHTWRWTPQWLRKCSANVCEAWLCTRWLRCLVSGQGMRAV